MEHKWLRNFDSHGNWTKDSRDIRIESNGVIITVDMDEYAKDNGIVLPDSKKQPKQKTKVNSNEDIREQDDSGVDPESGNGISEDTE